MMTRTNHTIIRKLAALGAAALLLSSTACSAHGNASANTDTDTMRVAYLSTANYLTTLKNEQFAQDELAPATVEFTGPYNPADRPAPPYSRAPPTPRRRAPARSSTSSPRTSRGSRSPSNTMTAIRRASSPRRTPVSRLPQGSVRQDHRHRLQGRDRRLHRAPGVRQRRTGRFAGHRGGDEPQQLQRGVQLGTGRRHRHLRPEPGLGDGHARCQAAGQRRGLRQPERLDIHIVSQSFADQHPDLVKAMYRALVKESDKAQEHPEIITDAYREFGASDEIVDQVASSTSPRSCRSTPTGSTCWNSRRSSTWTSGSSTRCPTSRATLWIARSEAAMTLTLDHIRMTFDGHEVLRDVTVHVDDGRFVSLIGRSGCGKSTRCCAWRRA